jgi:hypothetical protein
MNESRWSHWHCSVADAEDVLEEISGKFRIHGDHGDK